MTYLIKLSSITLKNIGRDGIRNIIIVIFVAVSVFLMNISLATFRHCRYLNRLIESSGLYDSYMYAGTPTKQVYYDNDEEDMIFKANDYVRRELENAKTDGSIMDYYYVSQVNASITEDTDIGVDFVFAKHDLLRELSFPVMKGEWFDTYSFEQSEEALVPIVIGYSLKRNYKIGQIVTLDGFGFDCIVIGVLKRNTLFISPNASGSGIDLNAVTQNANNMVIVAKEYEDIDASLVIRLSDSNREVSKRIVLEKIADIVDAFAFDFLADKAYENNIYATQMQTTLSILALLICIIGIGCGNLLSFVRGIKRQAVYFLCGMPAKTGVLSVVFEGLLKLYIPALFGLCMFFRYCRREEYDGLYVDGVNVLITGLIITVIFAAALYRTFLVAKNNSSLKIIHS